MTTAQEIMSANQLREDAQPIIDAFDDAAEPRGRQLAYVALIKLMETFASTSPAPPEDVLQDFCARVMAGINQPKATRQ